MKKKLFYLSLLCMIGFVCLIVRTTIYAAAVLPETSVKERDIIPDTSSVLSSFSLIDEGYVSGNTSRKYRLFKYTKELNVASEVYTHKHIFSEPGVFEVNETYTNSTTNTVQHAIERNFSYAKSYTFGAQLQLLSSLTVSCSQDLATTYGISNKIQHSTSHTYTQGEIIKKSVNVEPNYYYAFEERITMNLYCLCDYDYLSGNECYLRNKYYLVDTLGSPTCAFVKYSYIGNGRYKYIGPISDANVLYLTSDGFKLFNEK